MRKREGTSIFLSPPPASCSLCVLACPIISSFSQTPFRMSATQVYTVVRDVPNNFIVSTGTTCETSTTPEVPKTQEVKLNFGPNKSLSYLDRMLLKKHQSNPNFISRQTPLKDCQGSSKDPKSDSSPQKEIEVENQLGTNYREIFQSLGALKKKNVRENGMASVAPSRGVIAIEEITDDELSAEETTACIVDEHDSNPHTQSLSRPVSRSGRVSIMCMTPRGNFEADSDALVLQDVSPVSSVSPSLEQTSSFSRLGVRGANSRTGQNIAKHSQIKEQSDGSSTRVWSPQPCHIGLSEFFLAGVKDGSPPGRQSRGRVSGINPSQIKPDNLSQTLLARNVWKPQDSVLENEVSQQRGAEEVNISSSEVRPQSPRPIIPLLREPTLCDRPDSKSSTIAMPVGTDIVYDAQIHDFGIVDFLKTQPPNGFEDYSLVHRVSTVSELALSPNPPVFHWSDDSDDDFLEQLCSRVTQGELRADQDEADRATLTDLAWELASTTGRLTQCELDEDEEGTGDKKAGSEDEFDEDSIENNDLGSGLSSSEEDTPIDSYSANANRTRGDDDETALAEAEVHALK